MANCSIQLLGGLSITFGEAELMKVTSGAKARLLIYLILGFDMPLSRKQIAFDLWPDSSEKQALSNLRKLLHDLRESLPAIEDFIEITPVYIQWKSKPLLYFDVKLFELTASSKTLVELRKAEELYKGELLPGLQEEWIQLKRERLARTYLNVLDKLIAILENQREYTTALAFANKLLLQNDLREDSYRTLMRLHALNNDMTSALQIYEQLLKVLKDDLGFGPAEETLQLLTRITQAGLEPTPGELGRSPFIGRTKEWEIMVHHWNEAAIGKNSILLLKGEPGLGKSRLILEFKASLERQGYQTALSCCYQSLKWLSYAPVITWLRSVPFKLLDTVWLSELSRLLPELLERFPDLPKPKPVQETWQLNQWYEAIERMLVPNQPLLLMLDDIQWSDQETLQLITYLLRNNSRTKLFVLGAIRSDDYSSHALESFLTKLHEEQKLVEIELLPLTKEETRQVIASTIGEEFANINASDLFVKVGGNPFFIMETVQGWITSDQKGQFQLTAVMESILENRLNKLNAESQELLVIIALMGRPVGFEFIASVSGMKTKDLLKIIKQLVHLNILMKTEDEKFDFSHGILREAAESLGILNSSRQLHLKLANVLIALYPEGIEAAAAEIAYHFEQAGLEKHAAHYYGIAAAAAEKIYANETIIKYYQKVYALIPVEKSLPVLLKLGDALITIGNWAGAEEAYSYWLEETGKTASLHERSLCEIALGNSLRLQGKYEEASRHLERSQRYYELVEDPDGLSLVYGNLGMLYNYTGKYDKALYYLTKRLDLSASDNQRKDDCRFYGIMGGLYYNQGEYEKAICAYKEQFKLANINQDKNSASKALGGMALVHLDSEQTDLAFDYINEKITISLAIGDRMGLATAMGLLGKYYGFLGSYTIADQCIAYCIEEAIAVKDWRFTANLLGWKGSNLLEQQRFDEAKLFIERSLLMCRQLHIPHFECNAVYLLCLWNKYKNEMKQALMIAEEALPIADKLNRREMRLKLHVMITELKMNLNQISLVDALAALDEMLNLYTSRQEQATLYYTIWKLTADSAEYRTTALLLNEELYQKSGKIEYAKRCTEISGSSYPTTIRPLSHFAFEATHNKDISAENMEQIKLFLNVYI